MTNKSNSEISELLQIANQYDKHIIVALGLPWNNGVQCACPIHHGDNPSGFSYCPNRKVWSCWTHDCHSKYRNNLIGLVRGIKQCSFRQAIEFIQSIIQNPDHIPIIQNSTDDIIYRDEIFPESSIAKQEFYVPELINLGFRYSTLEKFQIFKCMNKAPMYGRIVFPFRNDRSEIVGFMGYRTDTIVSDRKWLLYPKGFRKRYHLFGLYLVPKPTSTIYIVEGAKDVLRMYEAGFPSVGISGRFITNEQIKLLKQRNVSVINLVLDPDDVGMEASRKIKQKLDLLFDSVNIFTVSKDPGKLSIDKLRTELAQQ